MTREPSPLDSSARALFTAARQEVPSSELRAQTLAAMLELRRSRSERRWGAVSTTLPWLLAAAAVALWVTLAEREPDPSPITAEPVAASSRSAPSAVPGVASAAPQLPAEPAPVELAPPPRASAPRPAPSLAAEVAALDRARKALDSDDPKTALFLLEAYERRGAQRLAAEATLLRIEALARAGRTREADALARAFLAANPGSPLVDRAREFLDPGLP